MRFLVATLFLSMTVNTLAESEKVNPFFAISFGFEQESMIERVEFLYGAGFDGIAGWVFNEKSLGEFEAIMSTPEVRDFGFQVFGVYMPLGKDDQKQRALITKVLQAGQSQNVPIWLTLRDADASMDEIVEYISDVCDEANTYGTDVILYPHDRHFAMYAEKTVEIIKLANKPNLFTTLHLNHELRAGNVDRLEEVVRIAAPYTKLASVSGANAPGNYNQGSRDWSDVVQPLKGSEFDSKQFYKLLRKYGYDGPVGYNNWKIPGDDKEHHRETLAEYRSWQVEVD